jgi:ribosomal protein S27AE
MPQNDKYCQACDDYNKEKDSNNGFAVFLAAHLTDWETGKCAYCGEKLGTNGKKTCPAT